MYILSRASYASHLVYIAWTHLGTKFARRKPCRHVNSVFMHVLLIIIRYVLDPPRYRRKQVLVYLALQRTV